MNPLRGLEAYRPPSIDPQILRPFLLTGVGAAAVWTSIYTAVGAWIPAVITLGTAAGLALCLVFRDRLPLTLVTHLAVGITYAAVFALLAVTGGHTGIVAPWIPVLAIVGAFLLTPAGSAVWGAILVVLTAALLVAGNAGVAFSTTIPEAATPGLLPLSILTAVMAAVILVYFFSRIQYDARASVAEANRNLRRMLDTVPEPLIVFSPLPKGRFRCIYVNEPMIRMVGDDLTGLHLDEMRLPEPRATRVHLREVTRYARRMEGRQRVRLHGTERLIQVISQPLMENRQVRQIVTIVQDLTRQAEDQKRLLHSARLASIGELVAGVAHEIRNPLTIIGGTAEIMGEHTDDELEEDIHAIRASTQRAARIVDGLLQFARQTEPQREVIDLNDVVGSVLDLRQQLLIHHGIGVRVHLAPEPVAVMGDAAQLEQVVLNLINNAERAVIDGGDDDRWIDVRTEYDEHYVSLVIEDSGGGIAPETLSQVFDPFFTTRPVGEGTGLGLSVSHGIVEDHGGTVDVRSPEGGGAIFSVTLPRAAAPPRPEAPAEESPAERPQAGGLVLVVDDEPGIRHVTGLFLSSCGYDVREAQDGEEALRMAESEEFDAVVLDWRMPKLGGAEVYARWRRDRPALADRVIIATGDVTAEDASGGPAATGRPVLAKPFELNELTRLLASILPGIETVDR